MPSLWKPPRECPASGGCWHQAPSYPNVDHHFYRSFGLFRDFQLPMGDDGDVVGKLKRLLRRYDVRSLISDQWCWIHMTPCWLRRCAVSRQRAVWQPGRRGNRARECYWDNVWSRWVLELRCFCRIYQRCISLARVRTQLRRHSVPTTCMGCPHACACVRWRRTRLEQHSFTRGEQCTRIHHVLCVSAHVSCCSAALQFLRDVQWSQVRDAQCRWTART